MGSGATVADLVGRTLAQLGAGHVFGVVGSGNLHVTNSLRQHGVPFTAARHEGCAAVMADAYARMSERVGVLTVHQGCGLTNALTGIGEAAKGRTPVLVLTVGGGRQDHLGRGRVGDVGGLRALRSPTTGFRHRGRGGRPG